MFAGFPISRQAAQPKQIRCHRTPAKPATGLFFTSSSRFGKLLLTYAGTTVST